MSQMAEGMGLTSNLLHFKLLNLFNPLGDFTKDSARPRLADSNTKDHTHRCGRGHGKRAPEGDTNGSLDDAGTSG